MHFTGKFSRGPCVQGGAMPELWMLVNLNACKLDREENIFDFYVEPIASKIKILINNVTLF